MLRRRNPPLGTGARARGWDGLRFFGGRASPLTFEEVVRGLGYVQLNEGGRIVMQEMRVVGACLCVDKATFCVFAVEGNNMPYALDAFGDEMGHDFWRGRKTLLRGLGRTLQLMRPSLRDYSLPSVGLGRNVSVERNALAIGRRARRRPEAAQARRRVPASAARAHRESKRLRRRRHRKPQRRLSSHALHRRVAGPG